MDDDEIARRMRAVDPAETPAWGPLTDHELATLSNIVSGRRTRHARWRARVRPMWVAIGAVVAVGGAFGGVAVAQSMMPHGFRDAWADVDYSHSFTLPSGRGCELRVMVVDEDGGRDLSGASAEVSERIATGDLWGALDWQVAALRDAREAELSPGQTMVLDENGRLGDASVSPTSRTPDDVRASIVSFAVEAALVREVAGLGVEPGEVSVWDSLRCDTATK